jgi:carbamoyltransferase
MNILGINSAYHESSACLIQDGRLVAAVEEGRFNRIKHGKPAQIDNPQELPVSSIRHCLEAGGISFAEVDHVGFAFDPKLRLGNLGREVVPHNGGWSGTEGEQRFQSLLATVPDQLRTRLGMPSKTNFHWLNHHLCQAGSAYLVSPFPEAAILTIDGIGEFATTHAAVGTGNKIDALWEINYPNSLGFLWEKMARLLGFGE